MFFSLVISVLLEKTLLVFVFRSRSPLEEKGESRRGGGGGEGEDGEYQDDGDTDREGGSTPEYGDHAASSRKTSSSKGRSSKSRSSSSKKTSIVQQVCPPKHFLDSVFY